MSASGRVLGTVPAVGVRWCAVLLAGVVALAGCERKTETSETPEATTQAVEQTKVGVLPEGAPQPNIIIILVDALRADRLAAYGNSGKLSPTMDAFAASGMVFDRCVSAAPWTLPSVATLFTSYYPGVHKATSYRVVAGMEDGKQAYQSVLSDDFDTFAEVLHANGYQTAGFVAAKFLRKEYGFGQGFEHYDTSFADNTVRGELVNQAFLTWFDEQRDESRPLFTYLHYMDVHGPYDAAPQFMDPLMKQVEDNPNKQLLSPREFRAINAYLRKPPAQTSDPERFERLKGYREYWEARYNAGVREMDFHLMQLFKQLKERGLWENSLIILTADHGEALCEHGLWDHGYSLYQTDLHVPLVMRWPGVVPAGKRVRRLASLIDVMPTLLEQLRLPPGTGLQGQSLVAHMSGTLPSTPQVRLAEAIKSGPRQFALFTDVTKLMVTYFPARALPDGSQSKGTTRTQLFNLGTDPGEQFNVADQNPDVAKQMGKLMGGVIQRNMQTKPELVVQRQAIDEATRRQLESVGYIGGAEEEDDEPNDPVEETPATSQPAAPAADADEQQPAKPGP